MKRVIKWARTLVDNTPLTPVEIHRTEHTGIETPDDSEEEFHSDGRRIKTASEMQREDVIGRREERSETSGKTPEKQDPSTDKRPSNEPMIKLPKPVTTRRYKMTIIAKNKDKETPSTEVTSSISTCQARTKKRKDTNTRPMALGHQKLETQ